MAKFGKLYRKIQLEEWRKHYINYKLLKQKIKEMKKKLFKTLRNTEGPRPEILSIPLIPDDDENESEENKEKRSSIYKDEKGQYLKEFIELLMNEFKRSYKFFKDIEEILVKKMNHHLYIQTNYSTYTIEQLTKEMKSLNLTVYLTKNLNNFINDIMTAFKKILKKFDKNFSNLFGLITPNLIIQLLTKKNSELEYLLQFKIIDEINTIAESNMNELKRYFEQNNENSANDAKYRNEFLEKYDQTFKFIRDIDELADFKTQYKSWIDFTNKRKTIIKGYKYFENDIFNPILSSSYYKDNLLDKFLSTKEAFTEVKKIQNPISKENKRNIILILAQTFFYNTLLTCIFPIFYFYEYVRSIEKSIYNEIWFVNVFIFLVVSSIYIAQFLSIFIFYNYTSKKKFKNSILLVFYIFIFIGSITYIFSIFYNQGHFKLRALILGFSLSLIGFGSNSITGKKYITIYAPRYYLPMISKIYLITELLGQIIGPLISALLMFFQLGKVYCILNCIGHYGVLGSLILFILHCILFIPPHNEKFLILKSTLKDENLTSSQSTQPFFGDLDDTQDKEFYKLQKEKKNQKNKLEVTKSDEIKIEINDNEQSKEGTSNDINIKDDNNEDEEKEKDDNEYQKIMEKAGDLLSQNEITKNYYNNNIDTGRYSGVDITNEERKTIQEIETKLYEFQEKTNFNLINMMPRTLDDIIINEQKTFGYLNRNLLIIIILLFFNSLIKENLIVHSSYAILFKVYNNGSLIKEAKQFIKDDENNNNDKNTNNYTNINNVTNINNDINNNNDTNINNYTNVNNITDINNNINIYIDTDTNNNIEQGSNFFFKSFLDFNTNNETLDNSIMNYSFYHKGDLQIICLLTSVIFSLQLLSLLFIMPFYKVNLIFRRNIIIFMIFSVVFMVPLSFKIFYINPYIYAPIVSIDIILHKIIETMCSCYLVYLLPPKWQYSHIRASSLPIYLMTLGKAAGCIFCIASYDTEKIEINLYILTGITFFVYGFISLFLYRTKNFRVTALSRILRNKALEESFV